MEPSSNSAVDKRPLSSAAAGDVSSNNSAENTAETRENLVTVTSTSCSEASSSAPINTSNIQSQSHQSTAQKVFSGRPQAGLMCSNLRANPFSVAESNASGILAKPKFSLKPSSFVATGDSSLSVASSDQANALASSNPFLRPAKLNYDNEESENGSTNDKVAQDGSTNDKVVQDGSTNHIVVQEPVNSSNQKAPCNDKGRADTDTAAADTDSCENTVSSSSDKLSSSSAKPKPILAAASSTEGFTFGSSMSSRASQSSFVFGEALDARATNVTKENGNHEEPDEAQKPKMLTLEEAADEYKKQQVTLFVES